MEVSMIDLTREEAEELFPVEIAAVAALSSSYVFAMNDADKRMGYAIYNDKTNREGDINLIFFAVDEDYRGHGYGEELLATSENILKKSAKVTNFFCKYTADFEEIDGVDSLMQKMGYGLISFDGRRIQYKLKDILNTVFAEKIRSEKAIIKPVVSYNELTKAQIGEFHEKLHKKGRSNFEEDIDPVFARFYIDDKKIVGFENLKEVIPGTVLLTDYFIEKSDRTKLAFPIMLGSALNVSAAFMPEDTTIMIQIDDDNLANGLETVFGEPMVLEYTHEYYKRR